MTATSTPPARPAKQSRARQDRAAALDRAGWKHGNPIVLGNGLVAVLTAALLSPAFGESLSPLHVAGRHFVDARGRIVILRGVNLTGDAKVPPFLPSAGPRDLDRVASLGLNVVRLLFLWEAYEPLPGRYDEGYLGVLRTVAEQAAARGVYTIVDIHQDGFSRHTSRGAGDGFPAWAVSRRGTCSTPDNSPSCCNWPILMATDPTTHRSFDDFFADAVGVRTRFLHMIDRVAAAFATVPGVIGYDLLNEPWGDEKRELAPLYGDMGAVIRARHPGAILFIEGNITTNCGIGTKLPRPTHCGYAYAPHYYSPRAMTLHGWRSTTLPIDLAFDQMSQQAQQWDCPLFVGEFGLAATAKNAGEYVRTIYDRLDASLASGAQWNLTPGWDPRTKDGWNGEDFSVLDTQGNPRPNFSPRPFPRITAGIPLRFEYHDTNAPAGGRTLLFTWDNSPALGPTRIAIPDGLFRPGTRVETTPQAVVTRYSPAQRSLDCHASFPGLVTVRVLEPGIETRAESPQIVAGSPGR
jgi:endoglycosylceramidase